jgi:hypothetical protein
VADVGFFGPELSVSCRLANGRLIRVPIRSDNETIPSPGMAAELGVAPEKCRIVADD